MTGKSLKKIICTIFNFHFTEKIVVNCGSPFVNNRDWNHAMRSTAAHSSLNINEINHRHLF